MLRHCFEKDEQLQVRGRKHNDAGVQEDPAGPPRDQGEGRPVQDQCRQDETHAHHLEEET